MKNLDLEFCWLSASFVLDFRLKKVKVSFFHMISHSIEFHTNLVEQKPRSVSLRKLNVGFRRKIRKNMFLGTSFVPINSLINHRSVRESQESILYSNPSTYWVSVKSVVEILRFGSIVIFVNPGSSSPSFGSVFFENYWIISSY